MGNKVIPSNSIHRDSHPSLYKGNHRDHNFSLLLIGVPPSLFAILNKHSWWDLVLSFKALYTLGGVY